MSLKKRKQSVFFLVLVLVLSPAFFRIVRSNDIWKHLYFGRYLSFFGKFPHHATFSFSPVNEPLARRTYNWLTNVIFYDFYLLGGMDLLLVLRAVILLSAIYVLFLLFDGRTNAFTLILFIVVVYAGAGPKLVLRGFMFAVVLAPLTLYCLRWADEDNRSWWVLFLLVTVWSNVHGNYYLGLGMIIFWISGQFLDAQLRKQVDFSKKSVLILLVLVLACGFVKPFPDTDFLQLEALFFESTGQQNLGSIWHAASDYFSRLEYFVEFLVYGSEKIFTLMLPAEYKHPLNSLGHPVVVLNYFAALVGLVGFCFRYKQCRFKYLLPFLFVVLLGIPYRRTLPFVLLLGPPLLYLQWTKTDVKLANPRLRTLTRFFAVVTISCLGLMILSSNTVLKRWARDKFPSFLVRGPRLGWGIPSRLNSDIPGKLVRLYPKDKVVHSYRLGSYLTWKWWPFKKVIIDSHIPAYRNFFVRQFFKNWRRTPPEFLVSDVTLALFLRPSVRRQFFVYSDKWKRLMYDRHMVVYQRKHLRFH